MLCNGLLLELRKWQSHPENYSGAGRNFKPMGSSYYDNVDGKGPTTWQMILRSENMRTFASLDKDGECSEAIGMQRGLCA